jgi:hypothetical protein
MEPTETWFKWAKIGAIVFAIGLLIYVVTMVFITALK